METRVIEPKAKLPRKKNVCAYARVSIEKEMMEQSLEAQISYYSEYIQNVSEWNYAGVYSDYGITGTKEERPGFQKMIKAALEGKIDIIITKSISRFARNTDQHPAPLLCFAFCRTFVSSIISSPSGRGSIFTSGTG